MNTKSISTPFPTINFEGLAPESYFQEVINRMLLQGFEFLAKIRMNSYTHTHHNSEFTCLDTCYELQYMYDRSTMLFFYVPNKAMIVKLELGEVLGKRDTFQGVAIDHDYYSAHWGGNIFLNYDWGKANLDFGIDTNRIYPVWHNAPEVFKRNISLYDPCLELRNAGYDNTLFNGEDISFYQLPASNRAPLEKLVYPFGNILVRLNAYLRPSFKQLGVTHFPSGFFLNYHKCFWDMFPLEHLRKLAERIQGSIFSD